MIGLRRGVVQLCPHQQRWEEAFRLERDRLMPEVRDLIRDVAHVGSTAVPGLLAKPIIDIAVLVDAFSVMPTLSDRLRGLGWLERGFINERKDDYLFVMESAEAVRTHHLHVVDATSDGWSAYLRFRDLLRRDQALREEYANLKQRLQSRFATDRASYTSAKESFITAALEGQD